MLGMISLLAALEESWCLIESEAEKRDKWLVLLLIMFNIDQCECKREQSDVLEHSESRRRWKEMEKISSHKSKNTEWRLDLSLDHPVFGTSMHLDEGERMALSFVSLIWSLSNARSWSFLRARLSQVYLTSNQRIIGKRWTKSFDCFCQ